MSPVELKEIRERLGLTQQALAEAIGVAKLTISQYETGFRKPGPTVLILMRVLDSLSKKKALELLALFQEAATHVAPRQQSRKK